MRLRLFAAAAAVLAFSLAARADDLFVYTSNNGKFDLNFSLPNSPAPSIVTPSVFLVDTPATSDGLFFPDNGVVFYSRGGLDGGYLTLSGPVLFSGTTAHPTFLLGTYNVGTGIAEGVLTISSAPTATPEPSSLALLGTGVLGVIGAARRRFAA